MLHVRSNPTWKAGSVRFSQERSKNGNFAFLYRAFKNWGYWHQVPLHLVWSLVWLDTNRVRTLGNLVNR